MVKYLVTGGFGFIGAHLVQTLIQRGNKVRVLDNLFNAYNKDKIINMVDFIEGDIRDAETGKFAMKNIDGCFHLAAIVSIENSLEDWVGVHTVNLTGTINIFNQAHLHQKKPIPVVYASSTAVYGESTNLSLKESDAITPLSAYGADKLGGEFHAKVASHVFHIPTFGLRIFNTYGSWQNPDSPYSGVISKFIDCIANQQPLEIFGDGTQTRDFIHVDDVVYYLMKAMDLNTGGFKLSNVCTGYAVSINELAEVIRRLTSHHVVITHQQSRLGDVKYSCGSTERMLSIFRRQPEYTLELGLKKLIASYSV